jgi:methylmalonyl-CoA mutase
MPIKPKIERFVKNRGRRPRVLVSNMGRKSHDPDNQLLSTMLAEAGFDVDISPLHQTPSGTARMAVENDVHMICILTTEQDQQIQIADLTRELKVVCAENVKIVLVSARHGADDDDHLAAGVDLVLHSVPVDEGEITRLLNLSEQSENGI